MSHQALIYHCYQIGGVEAVIDVYSGIALGATGIVAPMAEIKYALSKFTDLIDNILNLSSITIGGAACRSS